MLYAGRHAERLHDILSDLGIEAPVTQKLSRDIVEREIIITGQTIPRGFEYPELRLAVVSEYELFGSEYRPETKPTKHPHNRLTLYDLSVGDLVVHEAHGIGRFTGVSTLTVDGKPVTISSFATVTATNCLFRRIRWTECKIYRRRGGKAKAFKTRLRRVAENRCKNAGERAQTCI